MADTLTPEEKKRLTEELTKYANEGASDDDLRQFRDAFISELKKKGGGQPDSGAPAAQPTKPSAPSFGQKITDKIVNSASETQIPLKTGLQQEEQKLAAEKKAKIPTSKYFEVDVEEKQDEAQAPKFADPVVVAKNSQKSKAVFNSVVGDKDVYKMPTRGESNQYASDITNSYLDYLEVVGSSKSDTYKEKYKTLKAKSKADRTDQDEKFLRQVEAEAVGAFYDAKEWELSKISSEIDNLEKTAVTDEQKAQLNDLYGQYEKKRDSLIGTSSVYQQNKLQYGKIAGTEMVDEEAKLRRFEALQAGDGNAIEFFKGIGGAVVNGVLSVAQVPKVLGDLVGDKDYDWSDQMYDMVTGQKSDLDREFGAPLPQGKNMSDLPLAARLAVVGGNAIGSAGLFAAGGGLIGATSNIGKAAATFGTAFLTSESGYYQEALDAGMSPQEAALAGTYLAAQTALIESIIPDIKYFEPSAFRKSVIQGMMSGIGKGLPAREAVKLSLKNTLKALPEAGAAYGKTATKEAGEELLGQVGEDVGKLAINAAGQRQYFNDTFNGEAYEDAILGGFIAGGGLSVFSRPTAKSPIQEEIMREIVERRPQDKLKGTASDSINKEDLSVLDDVTEIYNAMSSHSGWNVMSREEQNHALALAQQAALMKKEQDRMKELRIPDERKDAEIKKLEDEVNQMFSMQMEQDKEKAKDAKLKAIEDEFNKSMEGEEFPVQEDERDQEIVELQKQREERGVNELDTFFSDMKPMVPFAVERIEQGQPVAQSVKQASSNYLYKKYKELTEMKSDPNRMMTRQQIANVQKQLEQDIRTLEGTTETKAQVNDQENVQGVSGEVGKGQEPVTTQPVESTSEEAPTTGGVLQAQGQKEVEVKLAEPPTVTVEGEVVEATPTAETAPETTSTPFQKQKDLLGNDKQPWMYEATEAERNQAKNADGKNTTRFFPKKISKIKDALQRGLFEKAIKEGKMTAQQAADVISSADIEVPASIESQLKETTETAPQGEPTPTRKPSFRERVSMMFDPQSKKAVDDLVRFHKAAGIDVKVIDDVEAQKLGQERNMEGSLQGLFIADKDSGVIYLNRDALKRAGKTLVYHEGIHPVINIVRNTNPELYKKVIDGLRAEAKRNPAIARAIRQVEAVKEYQNRGPETIEDETIVEVLARIAAGDIDINKVDKSLRDYLVDMWNKIAKAIGLPQVKANPTSQEFRDFANKLSTALTQGGTISDVVGAENVKSFQNQISLSDTNSVFANNSSQARFEMEFLEDSEDFTKLVEEGRVVHNASLDDINGETVVIHNPDNFSTGNIKFRGKQLVKGEGGVYFVLLYNDVWASGKKSSASQLASLINESLQKSTDGKGRLVLVKGDASKNLTSVKGAKALMGVMEILADDGLIPLGAFRKALNIAGKKYNINFDGRNDAKSIHKDIQDKFMNVSNSSFERRGDFVRDVIDAIANQNVLSKEAIAEIAESIGAKRKMTTFSKASILDSVAYATSERMLRDIPNSHVYAVIETSSKVKPEFVGKHESYPWHIVTEDGSKPILHILKDRPFYNDAFVAAKSTEKVKEGERFGDVSRAGLAQRGMGLAKVETTPIKSGGQASVDIDRSKPAEKPKKKKLFSIEKARELLSKAEYTSLTSALELLAEYPAYLDKVANVILTQRQKLLDGKMPIRDVAKAYILTQGSIGSDFRYKDVLEKDLKAAGLTWNSGSDSISLFEENGKIRPEELTAWWLGTPNGKLALNDLEKGIVNEAAFNELETIRRSYGKNNFRLNSVFGNRKDTGFKYGEKPAKKNQFNLANIAELTQAINETKGDNEKLQNLLTRVNGISEGKKGFIGHMLGIGNMPTVDAVELNFWFTGKGEANIKDLDQIKAQTITAIRENISALNEDVYREISGRIKELSEQISQKYPNVKIPEEAMQHVLHHWIWDKARASATTHTGMYQALGQYSADIERTNDETRVLMEDAGDAMELAVAAGTDPQEAVDDIVGNKDWYKELSQDQKQQFDEILQEYFGVTPNAPAQKATGIKATIANIIDNYYKGDRQSKLDNKQILESDPKLEYIYLNIAKINKQLQEAGVITAKTDGCP